MIAKFLNEYKKNFSAVEKDDLSAEKQKKIDDESFMKYRSVLFIFSVVYNLIYFLLQIIFFKTENEWSNIAFLTIGLFSSYLLVSLICLILIKQKCLKINFNIFTFLSYLHVYLHILIVSFLCDFSKSDSDFYAYNIYVYDFNLVLTGCLVILSCESVFMVRHKYKIISYFILILGLILFRTISAKEFLKSIYFESLSVLMFSISFWAKKRINISKKNCAENSTDTQKVFKHFNSVNTALGVGIFLFREEELFFANDVAGNLLKTAPMMPLNQFSDVHNHSMIEIKPSINHVDIKVSMSDSNININQSNADEGILYHIPKEESDLKQQKEAKILFQNMLLFEDTSNISETVTNSKRKKASSELDGKLNDNISFKNSSNNQMTKLSLYSIFSYLSDAENDSLLKFNEHLKLGIFESQVKGGKKLYYKIIVKVYGSSSPKTPEQKEYEFIFEDVTVHCDLLNKIKDDDLQFKKNAHEFKTPILSLLGCAEELKSRLNSIENLLPQCEKIIINNYLDHMTNLSSYTGYLIKGLTKNSKEINQPNSPEDYKKIKLNSLLSFSFNILQTLLGCDSQKFKQVKTELINNLIDYDVSFNSDEIQVKQILLNFISNSVKFTNHGSIAMEAKLKKGIQNNILKITIKDTGCGIKNEDKSKLFQEYAKFDNTENNAYGTGLGLNICKSMADKMNMKIKFKSEENKGTKVILYVFNPVINKKEKFSSFHEASRITGQIFDLRKETNLKSTSENITNSLQYRVINENGINLEDIMIRKVKREKTKKIKCNSSQLLGLHLFDKHDQEANDESNKTITVNEVMAEINYSLISLKSPSSYQTFNIDANNMKSTKRLGIDHNYWINYSERYLSNEILPRCKLKKKSNKSSRNIKRELFSLNYMCNSLQIPLTLNHDIQGDNCVSLRENEIKVDIEKSLNSLLTLNIKTKKSVEAEKILVVDDQMHARRALANLITKHCKERGFNFDIIEECDGIECLNTIIKNPFNIRYVFIDENMNYMNGRETAEIIRRLANSRKIRNINIIFTTADDTITYKKDLFDFCVTKPLNRRNIQDILQHLDKDIVN